MATMKTRIVLKNDSLENWNAEGSIVLKQGEIGLARVNVDIAKDGTGAKLTKPVYLMKVGDGEQAFSALEWLAAPASDVYAWAKKQSLDAADLPEIPASKIPTLSIDKLPALGISNITGLQAALDGKVDNSVFDQFKTDNTKAIGDAVSAAIAQEVIDRNAAIKEEADRAKLAEQANAAAAKAADDKAVALAEKVGEVPENKTVVSMIEEAQEAATYDDTEVRELIGQKADTTQVAADIATAVGNAKTSLINNEIKAAGDAAAAAQGTANQALALGQAAATQTALEQAQSTLQGNIDKKLDTATFNSYKTTNDAAVQANADEIASLKNAVSGAMHFKGEVSAIPPAEGTYAAGDVVLKELKEYVYDGTNWIELGDEGSLATQDFVTGKINEAKTALQQEIDDDVAAEAAIARAAERAASDAAAAAQAEIDALELVAIQNVTGANGVVVSGTGTARQVSISAEEVFVLDCGTATTVQ